VVTDFHKPKMPEANANTAQSEEWNADVIGLCPEFRYDGKT
jgi:hypothetical protein